LSTMPLQSHISCMFHWATLTFNLGSHLKWLAVHV
jgi:hypothetical protein